MRHSSQPRATGKTLPGGFTLLVVVLLAAIGYWRGIGSSDPELPSSGSGASSQVLEEREGSAARDSAAKDASESEFDGQRFEEAGPPLYGYLQELGSEIYVSPAGLRYTRGSAEGHRLKHLERHLEDIPDRPNRHGVFSGGMTVVLKRLDTTYERASRGEQGTSRKQQGDRDVLEARFDQPVGFVGGREGKRMGNPDADQVRLVVEGTNVITAFPF